MARRPHIRLVAATVALVTIAALIWSSTLPTKAECLRSGRLVDPTERHCEASDGYEQLQEHVWFHTSEVLLGIGMLGAATYVGRRYHRRRRGKRLAPTA